MQCMRREAGGRETMGGTAGMHLITMLMGEMVINDRINATTHITIEGETEAQCQIVVGALRDEAMNVGAEGAMGNKTVIAMIIKIPFYYLNLVLLWF